MLLLILIQSDWMITFFSILETLENSLNSKSVVHLIKYLECSHFSLCFLFFIVVG